jgi:hypothetical protein
MPSHQQLVILALTRLPLGPKAKIDPKNEAKKIKAPDRFADFLHGFPSCAAKLRTGFKIINKQITKNRTSLFYYFKIT